jgi:Antibiotic biosynthesis monooxygenase
MNPVEIAALDALDLLVVVDNESDTLSSVDKGVPQLPELGRLVARVPHLAPKDGHDCVEPRGASVPRLPRLLGAGYGAARLRRALGPLRRRTLRRGLAGERASARVHRSRVPLALARGPQRRAPGGGGAITRSRLVRRHALDLAADEEEATNGFVQPRPSGLFRSNFWQDDAVFMKQQPGFISTQLTRAVGESPCYLNYAVWETTAHFRDAFTNPGFRAKLSVYPSSAVAIPHLFQKLAVTGVCVV